MENVKTANQLWRESGRQMSFKDFIEDQKRKGEYLAADGGTFMLNKPVNDSIQRTLTEMQQKGGGIAPSLSRQYILGIPKPYFYVGTAVLLGSVILYYTLKKRA